MFGIFRKNKLDNHFNAVERYFSMQNKDLEFNKKNLSFSIQGTKEIYGLENLFQQMSSASTNEWQDIIKNHFDYIERGNRYQKEFEKKRSNFSNIKDLLAVKLWPEDYIAAHIQDAVYQDFSEGIKAVVAFDLPDTISQITKEDLKNWGKTEKEIFDIALRNTKKKKVTIEDVDLGESVFIKVIESESGFASSNVLFIDEYKECIGKYGALIGVPTGLALICYPINDLKVVKTINNFIMINNGAFQRGPYSLTSDLFWYHEGEYIKLPYNIDGKTLNFTPPDDFIEMLNSLQE